MDDLPALFTLIWFVVFGWSAMRIDGMDGAEGPISAAVAESVPLAMFAFGPFLIGGALAVLALGA